LGYHQTRLHSQRLLLRDVVALSQHLQVILHKARFGLGQAQAQGVGSSRRGGQRRLGMGGGS